MKRLVLILLALAVAGVALRFTLFRERVIDVDVVRAGFGPVEDVVTNSESGTVRARRMVRLSAERAGTVLAIPHREGSSVRAGDTLLVLEPTAARLRQEAAARDLDAARGTLAAARATETMAARTHERTKELQARGLATREAEEEARTRLEAARAERRAAEARVAGATAAVRLTGDDLAHQQILAPFAGIVARRLVEVDETVAAGQAVLELFDPARLYVACPVDERDAGRLQPGLPARVTIDTYPGRTWSGAVSWVAPLVEEAKEENRTLAVEIDLASAAGAPPLRPGMTADAEIVITRAERALRVPSPAVMDGRRVFAVRGGRAVAVELTPGLRNWDWTEVRGGLGAGEAIVSTLDRPGFAAGVRLRVHEPAVPAAPAAPGDSAWPAR